MVVDNESKTIDIIKSFLDEEKTNIVPAANNREALEFLENNKENNFDLILVETNNYENSKKGFVSLNTKLKFDIGDDKRFLEKPFTKEQFNKFLNENIEI
jgi:two-component SAPR family response regulator